MSKSIEPKEGVYISQSGKLKVFSVNRETNKWEVDAGELHPAPLLKALKVLAIHEMGIGWPVFHYRIGPLYKCEWISEL